MARRRRVYSIVINIDPPRIRRGRRTFVPANNIGPLRDNGRYLTANNTARRARRIVDGWNDGKGGGRRPREIDREKEEG